LNLPQPWKDCWLCPNVKQALQYGSEPSIILPVPGSIGNPVVAKPANPCDLVLDMALLFQAFVVLVAWSIPALISKVDVNALS